MTEIIIPSNKDIKDFSGDKSFQSDFNESYADMFQTPEMKKTALLNTFGVRVNLKIHVPYKINVNGKYYCWYTTKKSYNAIKDKNPNIEAITWKQFAEMVNGKPLDKAKRRMLDNCLKEGRVVEITIRTLRDVTNLPDSNKPLIQSIN